MNNSISDQASARLSDPELDELLSDAFDAPPVPRSLLKRIDRAVEQEWGTSPRLADTSADRMKRSLGRGARWVKTLPIAAALSVFLVVTLFFLPPGLTAYGWADLVEALREQGMVLIETPEEARWMAAAEGVVATTDNDSSEVLNLKEGFLLDRSNGGQQIRRRRVVVGGDHREKMVLALILGHAGGSPSEQFLENALIFEEGSEEVSIGGRNQLQLRVRVESSGFRPVLLRLVVDPVTHLPTTCDVAGWKDAPETLAFSYPKQVAADVLAASFPSDLPVIDIGPDGQLSPDVVLNDVSTADVRNRPADRIAAIIPETNPPAPAPAPDAPAPDAPAPDAATPDTAVLDAPADVEVEVASKPMSGPPSQWQPVAVRNRNNQQIVQEMDQLLSELWKENGVEPTVPATDEELLRRVYLDLAGRTPGVNEVRTYLSDTSSQRYETLVDRLLASTDHATHLATTFRSFLISESVDLTRFGGVEAFDEWLSDRIQSDESYADIVQSLLLAEGRLSRSGPLLFYSASKLDAEQLAARTARVFLGTRLECAQCHDHPFEPWTQKDFWGFAAFFARISRPRGTLESAPTVLQVHDVEYGDVMIPDTEIVVAPKYLNAAEPLSDEDPGARRRLLAEWLTGRENPYFARATANRVWAQMFGKGIVEPLDDFGIQHPARSVELLDLLSGHLINTNFNLRELFRVVALSKAYQLSSGAEAEDEDRLAWFGQMNVKTLTAEQVYDCITVATLLSTDAAVSPAGLNVTRFGNSSRDAFLQEFRTPLGRPTEYQGGIPQALTLMNGSLIDGATALSSSGLLKSLEAPFFTNEQRIEVLYFSTLSRRPTPFEWGLLRHYISPDATGDELREGLSDILWTLLNCAEFTMNH